MNEIKARDFDKHFEITRSKIRMIAYKVMLSLLKDIREFEKMGFYGIAYKETLNKFMKIGDRFKLISAVSCAEMMTME